MDDNIYYKERGLLISEEQKQYALFDKYILTLSSGALGLSIAFIRDIAPIIKAGTIWILIVSWGSFCGSILSTLLSFIMSQSAYSRQRDILDSIHQKEKRTSLKNIFTGWVKRFNRFSMTCFCIGVIFLVVFTVVNLQEKEVNMSNEQGRQSEQSNKMSPPKKSEPKIEKGSVPPKPPVELRESKEVKKFGSVPPPPPKPKEPGK